MLAEGRDVTTGDQIGLPLDNSDPAAPKVVVTGTFTVDPAGLATSALQTSVGATAHTDSGLILAKLPAALGAHGGLVVEGVASGVPVPVSAAALPLPTGAAPGAAQATQITAEQATATATAAVATQLASGSVDVATNGDGSTVATEATMTAVLTATKVLAGFETLTLINYSSDQTNITDGSSGLWINTAGTLKMDTWGGATGVTFTVVVGLFPLRRVKKIYMTGSSVAAGYIGYPPA